MLAACVKMTYSIARFFQLKPALPCWVGGIFERSPDKVLFIRDAQRICRLIVIGDSAQFVGCQPGDLLSVEITAVATTNTKTTSSVGTSSGSTAGSSISGFSTSTTTSTTTSTFSTTTTSSSSTATEGLICLTCGEVRMVFRSRRSRPPPVGQRSADFARFVNSVRRFFIAQGMNEIFTPSFVVCPGLEPSLEPFSVEVPKARELKRVFLPTSPEISLKKALAQGWTDIFEIKSCFRKHEWSEHHENEFFMLEWYRGFADLEAILQDLQGLLQHLCRDGFFDKGSEGKAPAPELKMKLKIMTWAEIFELLFAFRLQPATSKEELCMLCARQGVNVGAEDSFNDVFHRLLVDKIEPRLPEFGPLIVRNFPPSQAALARLTSEGWADRFEFYWHGLEIANAFNEVNDPDEQRRRWQIEQSEREHLGTSALPQDEKLLESLQQGMPPAGGVALGVERLFMAFRQVKQIHELKLFATRDLFND